MDATDESKIMVKNTDEESDSSSDSSSRSSGNDDDDNASHKNDNISTSSDDDDDDESEGRVESDESSSSSSSASALHRPYYKPTTQDDDDDLDDYYATQVRLWAKRVPIGLGLCPWAMKSQRQGRLRYRTCTGTTPADVASFIISQAQALLLLSSSSSSSSSSTLSLSTLLIVCPHVTAWNEDFDVFDKFVRTFQQVWCQPSLSSSPSSSSQQSLASSSSLLLSSSKTEFGNQKEEEIDNDTRNKHDPTNSTADLISSLSLLLFRQQITLVSFHPKFLRWRGLPKGIKVGSIVQSHKGMGGFQKSQETFPARIIETSNNNNNPVFGLRKVKVRFLHDNDNDDNGKDNNNNNKDGGGDDSSTTKKKKNKKNMEQYVSTDWLSYDNQKVEKKGDGDGTHHDDEYDDNKNNDSISIPRCCPLLGPPLPDNMMHRAPYPTIHLIRNEDLTVPICTIRDVSRVKRKNAQRMMKLGWEGMLRKSAIQ